jgi:hypothetical protein
MYADLKCRMDWCVQPYWKANHHPVAAFGGDAGDEIVRLQAAPGETIELDATGSKDPDGDQLDVTWRQYVEAGTYAGLVHIAAPRSVKTTMVVPTGAANRQIHVILEVRDRNAIAGLTDYRRIVIDVSASYGHGKLFRQKS